MSEYIKQSDAVTAIHQAAMNHKGITMEIAKTYDIARKAVESIPAADVEPVVRCKDCEYSGKIDSIFQTWCKKDMRRVNNNFYCAHGKEKLQHETD